MMTWKKNSFNRIPALALVLAMMGAPILYSTETADSTKPVKNKKDSSKSVKHKKDSGKDSKPPAKVASDENRYPQMVIGFGDILYITVYGETGGSPVNMGDALNGGGQLTTDYQVDSDGTITYPFLGSVQVAGL